jgi:hypothetical protein
MLLRPLPIAGAGVSMGFSTVAAWRRLAKRPPLVASAQHDAENCDFKEDRSERRGFETNHRARRSANINARKT